MKRTIFHPRADDEFAEAIAYYAQQSQRAGDRFYAHIQQLTAEVEAKPHLHRPWLHGTRRHFSRPFPYVLIYAERPTHIWIIAVAHFKRRPDYWVGRLE